MVISNKTPHEFLLDTEHVLEEMELENNLILGICNGFADKTKEAAGCTFIRVVEDGQTRAASIKTKDKAIVSGTTNEQRYMKELADYYHINQIDLKGVIGRTSEANAFADFYGKESTIDVSLIVHRLEVVNDLTDASGILQIAEEKDIDLILDWSLLFEMDSNIAPLLSREEHRKMILAKIRAGSLCFWFDEGQPVSMAGVIRKTKNIGIVGLVYTPAAYRGHGYATSLVKHLSVSILNSGLKYCGLFTDKSNPTSNHIYEKIGYQPITNYLNLGFK